MQNTDLFHFIEQFIAKMLDLSKFEGYQALIFDMDGTVIDTMPSHARAWQMVGERLGFPEVTGEVMYELGGAPVRTIAIETFKRHNIPLDLLEQGIELKREIGKQLVLTHSTLLPAAQVLKHFSGKKPTALGTGSHRALTQLLLEKFDLTRHFSAIVTAEDVARHKPAPDTFLRCADLLATAPSHCLVFEDADLGVQAALASKMDVFDVRTQQIIRA